MEFLLELLTEELPASHIRSAREQLESGFRRELDEARIEVRSLRTLATPRRLIVTGDLAEGQEDREEIVTGPPLAIAKAPDGSLTPAGKGFARSQGVDESLLGPVRTPKGEYLGFTRRAKGTPTAEILAAAVPRVLGSLAFPKLMRWAESPLRFSRPIHGLLCVFGGAPVAASFAGFQAGDETVGHRIAAPGRIKAADFASYRQALAQSSVIIDPEERRRMILDQIEAALAPVKARVYPDPGLLDDLTLNVECPLVIFGAFPESFLSLPLEVLSTAMREGQKLFSVVRDKKQLPYFLGVADAPADAKGLIRRGNERVLRARLEDARFFWDQDRKVPLADRAEGLESVLFQEKLGTYEDKTQRLKKIVGYLCDRLGAAGEREAAVEAASLCKADLLTEMVKEFSGLQGRMGGLYAKAEGLPPAVHQAIYEHYQPVGLDDASPSTTAGALLSIADKMDSIVGGIGVGLQVSGSSDPFGLRRNAHGVCKVVLDRKLRFSFPLFLDRILAVYGDRLTLARPEVKAACLDFFAGRLRFILEKKGWRYDLVNAALGPGIDQILDVQARVEALDALKSSPQFEPFILMVKRINNILKGLPAAKVNADLFVEKEERELASTLSIVGSNAQPMIARGDFARAQGIIFKLQPVLNTFFEKVLVMAEDKKIRQNRLGLLQSISKMLLGIADYSQVVVEGERTAKPKGGR
ncbi:MAG TPA: glycine--tRNA ligase subunit beta [Candidatus Aminicenantes bacterium]|nr:glycine--tRNA ligase subunit beta [Candidatus Aminicenantes bacterium]HRY65362.1 glycine--tRNA ligase subunit beta [Candidatus Aminicenantes bacterium]HRZ72170.1 glycine--tRNA ligase subunit beta [Candidatus Aminicenantes bacterium]